MCRTIIDKGVYICSKTLLEMSSAENKVVLLPFDTTDLCQCVIAANHPYVRKIMVGMNDNNCSGGIALSINGKRVVLDPENEEIMNAVSIRYLRECMFQLATYGYGVHYTEEDTQTMTDSTLIVPVCIPFNRCVVFREIDSKGNIKLVPFEFIQTSKDISESIFVINDGTEDKQKIETDLLQFIESESRGVLKNENLRIALQQIKDASRSRDYLHGYFERRDNWAIFTADEWKPDVSSGRLNSLCVRVYGYIKRIEDLGDTSYRGMTKSLDKTALISATGEHEKDFNMRLRTNTLHTGDTENKTSEMIKLSKEEKELTDQYISQMSEHGMDIKFVPLGYQASIHQSTFHDMGESYTIVLLKKEISETFAFPNYNLSTDHKQREHKGFSVSQADEKEKNRKRLSYLRTVIKQILTAAIKLVILEYKGIEDKEEEERGKYLNYLVSGNGTPIKSQTIRAMIVPTSSATVNDIFELYKNKFISPEDAQFTMLQKFELEPMFMIKPVKPVPPEELGLIGIQEKSTGEIDGEGVD